MKPKVIVLRTAGTNCDKETAFAFEQGGAQCDLVHINQLFHKEVSLADYHIMALPGGFTYGDDIESGRILANELRIRLGDAIRDFIQAKKLIIGICNGFQVLVKAGILPGELDEKQKDSYQFAQSVTLTHNDSGKFEDRWVYLKRGGDSVWTKGVKEIAYYPVAHAEGKFVTRDDKVLKALHDNGQIAFRYVSAEGAPSDYPHNPNGSVDDIAGITDVSGRILGLMPHPERHFFVCHHPRWTRELNTENKGDGACIFQNGVDYVKKELL